MDESVLLDIFESEASILKTLATIRNSTIPTTEKGVFRDLFLDFAGETDETRRSQLKEDILEKLAKYKDILPTLNIVQESKVSSKTLEEAPNQTNSNTGSFRRVPTFNIPTFREEFVAEPEKKIEIETKAEENISLPESPLAIAEVEKPTVKPETEIKEPLVVDKPEEEVIEVKEESKIEIPQELPQEEIKVEETRSVSGDLRTRIDEIKRDINGRVGNPINLISTNELIGREYMSALLDAMKILNSGGSQNEALNRLENAYKSALTIVDQVSTKKNLPKKEVTERQEIIAEPETTKEIENVTWENSNELESEDVKTPVVEPEEINEPEITSIPEEVEQVREEVKPEIAKPRVTSGLYHKPIDEIDLLDQAENKKAKPVLSSLLKRKSDEETENAPATPQTTAESSVRHLNIGTQNQDEKSDDRASLKSLKDSTTLPEKMSKLREEVAKREAESKKPITDLNSPEVQSGLEKLLSEWTLFKSSGFLGMGPKGIEHPLYKQLSTMPMAAVIAGRFEGATPQIKQSLTDYMNGWRYEQGIIHELGESFEHYLRRVIKQVLTRQRMLPLS